MRRMRPSSPLLHISSGFAISEDGADFRRFEHFCPPTTTALNYSQNFFQRDV